MSTYTVKMPIKVTSTDVSYTLTASEIKFFVLTKPTDTAYEWHAYTANTGTGNVALNDLYDDGMRLKNSSTQERTGTAVVYWLGISKS